MTQEYYIIAGKNQNGPYDLVMLVRKIRNGSLTAGTLISQGDKNTVKPAQEWPALAEFFSEKMEEKASSAVQSDSHKYSLPSQLRNGWRFLQFNQMSTVFSGLFVLAVMAMTGLIHVFLPTSIQVYAYMAAFIFSHFLLSCYLLSVLRLTRGQPIDMYYLSGKIFPEIRPLLVTALLVSFPSIIGVLFIMNADNWQISLIGLLILAIPGLFILTVYVFTPLVILDQGVSTLDAMEMSRKHIFKGGPECIGVLFAMFVINFIAGLCVLLPMVITLPITMSIVTDMYDDLFR